MKDNNKDKVLIIGLDGATWDIINPLLNEDKLPNFKKIMREGVYGNLQSTIPMVTPVAWRSAATGVNPGRHGIYGFQHENNQHELEPTNCGINNVPSIWQILSKEEKRVGIVNFPCIYPPEKVNGFFISGYTSPKDGVFTYPEELKEYLISKNYRIYIKGGFNDDDPDGYLHELKKIIKERADVSIDLLRRNKWDFLWVIFMETDWSHHFFWNRIKDIHDVYIQFDEILGRFLSEIDDDVTLLIMSDHGGGEVKKNIYINKLLQEWGYLHMKEQFVEDNDKKSNQVNIKRFLRGAYKSSYNTALQLHKQLKKLNVDYKKFFPQWIAKKIRKASPTVDDFMKIDWNKTKAYSIGYNGEITINIKGKFVNGVVDPDGEYEELRKEIIQRLYELKHPDTGDDLIDRVYSKEEVYSGPELLNAPDIIYFPKNWETLPRSSKIVVDSWFSTPESHAGDHRPEGIFMMRGKMIKKNLEISDASIMDITPTLLYIFDKKIPKNIDGKILTHIFNEEYVKSKKIDYIDPGKYLSSEKTTRKLSKEEVEQIREQLKGLGYLG